MGGSRSRHGTGDDWKREARYAMGMGSYCAVCGGPFNIAEDVHIVDPKEPRHQVRMLSPITNHD